MTNQLLPNTNPQNAPMNSDSLAAESVRSVKTEQGILFGLSGYNKGPAQYVQLHDLAAPPTAGAVPALVIPLSIGSTTPVQFSIDFGVYGRRFTKGIQVVNSTTEETYTAGANDCRFNARYK